MTEDATMNNQSRRSFFKSSFKMLTAIGLGGIFYSAARFLGSDSTPETGHSHAFGAFHPDNERMTGSGGGLRASKAADGRYELETESVPAGVGAVVSAGSLPILVVHGTNGFRVFNATCTHLGCLVKWDPAANMFICPCHGGKYDANGQVIAGPPPSALKEHTVAEKDDMIRIAIT